MANFKICKKMDMYAYSPRRKNKFFPISETNMSQESLRKSNFLAMNIRYATEWVRNKLMQNTSRHPEQPVIKRYPNEKKLIKLQFTYLQRTFKSGPCNCLSFPSRCSGSEGQHAAVIPSQSKAN